MRLHLPVPPAAGPEGMLLRNLLRGCALSTDLLRGIKFHSGGFFADGRPVLANQRVFPGQVITFSLPVDEGGCLPQPEIPVQTAYEDFFAIVLDKPAGLAVHPTLNYPGGTLANGYAARRLAEGRSPVFRPVNRIDKDTSGLVLAAQNAYAAPLLARHVEKLYYAVVEGELPLGPGVIDAPIGRRPRQHHRPLCHPRRQTQPHRVYHYKSRKGPQPGGLRAGHRPDPPDPGPLRFHRPPPWRGTASTAATGTGSAVRPYTAPASSSRCPGAIPCRTGSGWTPPCSWRR